MGLLLSVVARKWIERRLALKEKGWAPKPAVQHQRLGEMAWRIDEERERERDE